MKRRSDFKARAMAAAAAKRLSDHARRHQNDDDFGIRPGVARALGLQAEPDAYDLHDVAACTTDGCAMCWFRKNAMGEG